jgi:hypothetical protein
MKNSILPLLTLLCACRSETAGQKEGPACIEERFGLTREERRRGFLLSEYMTNIEFGRDYTRRELVARYRLFRGGNRRKVPSSNDLTAAERIISERSGGAHDPYEVITASPCMYIKVIV